MPADWSFAVAGVTSATTVAAIPPGDSVQVITGQATICAAWWGAQQSRDLSWVVHCRTTATAKEVIMCIATDR
jgi:hypothetical protein